MATLSAADINPAVDVVALEEIISAFVHYLIAPFRYSYIGCDISKSIFVVLTAKPKNIYTYPLAVLGNDCTIQSFPANFTVPSDCGLHLTYTGLFAVNVLPVLKEYLRSMPVSLLL
jgi:hypothetical protein